MSGQVTAMLVSVEALLEMWLDGGDSELPDGKHEGMIKVASHFMVKRDLKAIGDALHEVSSILAMRCP